MCLNERKLIMNFRIIDGDDFSNSSNFLIFISIEFFNLIQFNCFYNVHYYFY